MKPSEKSSFIGSALLFVVLSAAPSFADLARRRSPVVEVVSKVSPAVVHIATERRVESRFRSRSNPLEDFFFGNGREQRQQAVESLGSGVIVDAAGLVVTNDHVIRGAAAVHVILADGRKMDADVIGSDADNDLAVLRIQGKGPFPIAPLGTSSDVMIGETTIAIGSPFGLKKTVTQGVVSATGRSFKADGRVYNDFLQTDASINPGNSGGPLLNIDGELIGINTAIFASAQGIGFAIPADKVRRIVGELTQFGKVRPSWVGIDVQSLNLELARGLGWDRNYGVVVTSVDRGSPAEKVGIVRGDIVVDVAGAQVEDAQDFTVRMRGYPAHSSFVMGLFRSGQLRQVTVAPVEFPPKLVEGLAWDRLGLRLRPSNAGLVVAQVRQGSAAMEIGLEPGDVVLRLNNQPLPNMDTFREKLLLARTSNSVMLRVRRGRYDYHVPLPF